MLDLFRQAAQSALALVGEGAFLRGNVACQVNIERGVQLRGYDDTAVITRDVATIESIHNPRVGDLLTHPDGEFKLDSLLLDTGAMRRFVILEVEP